MTAVSRPGSERSAVKTADPSTLPFESTRGGCVPISLKSFGSFSRTSPGTGSAEAASASSPNVARRPLAAWETTPFSTASAVSGTPHLRAAAETSMARATAPALRSCSQEFEIDELPPVPWTGPHERLL